eukprot:GHVT01006158.1.p1 GENE.GHVT01006158.1~~GHVT01006158.1.p1  ORF type:complete len:276 (-),score=41.61 GHVT01006158.1:492-1319(-)
MGMFSSLGVLERVARELVVDKADENVRVLEVRMSPHYLSRFLPAASFHDMVEATLAGLRKGKEDAAHRIDVGLILSSNAAASEASVAEIAKLAIQMKSEHPGVVVGFDNSGLEINLKQYKHIFDEVHAAGLGVTVHAAEDAVAGDPHNAFTAVSELHATRLGHGVQILRAPEVLHYVRQKQVCLEVCPTSNWITGGVSTMSVHPALKLWRAGIDISINSDDPGLFNCTLVDEYEIFHTELGFTLEDFIKINQRALEASFLPEEVKIEHRIVLGDA